MRAALLLTLLASACLTDPATFASQGAGGDGGQAGGAGGTAAGGSGGEDEVVVGGGSASWLRAFGDAEEQLLHGIAIGSDGALFVAGAWSGAFPIEPLDGDCGGAKHGFVMKLDPQGAPLWVRCFGGSASVSAIAAGDDGVAAIGSFHNLIDLGQGTESSAGDSDVFLVQLNDAGGIVWGHTFGEALTDKGLGVAVRQGSVFAGGSFRGDLQLGSEVLTASSSGADLFVARLEADGSVTWARRLENGSPGPQLRLAASDDEQVPLIAAGHFTGALDVDAEGPWSSYVPGSAREDVFVAGFDPEGDVAFFTPVASNGRERALALAVRDDRFVLAGSFDAQLDVDARGPLPALDVRGASDAFVFTGRLNGALESVSALAGDGDEAPLAAAWTSDAQVAVAGEFDGTLDLRAGVATASDGAEDAFVLAWPLADLEHPTLARTFGAKSGVQRVEALAAHDGSLYAAGSFNGTLDVGALEQQASGQFDIFIAKLP